MNPGKRIQHLYQERPPVVFKPGHNSGDLCPAPNRPPAPAAAVPPLLFLVDSRNVWRVHASAAVPKTGVISHRPHLRNRAARQRGLSFPLLRLAPLVSEALHEENDPSAKRICDRDGASLRFCRVAVRFVEGNHSPSRVRLSRTRILISVYVHGAIYRKGKRAGL